MTKTKKPKRPPCVAESHVRVGNYGVSDDARSFWGTQTDTFYMASDASTWLVVSARLVGVADYEEAELPPDAVELRPAQIPNELADVAAAIETLTTTRSEP